MNANQTKPQFSSRVDLPQEVKQKLIIILNVVLASTLDLHLQTKQAHWNIKGPQFFARHELFDRIADHLRNYADVIAERTSTLGGYAEGTARLTSQNSKLEEYNLSAVDGKFHLQTLATRFATYDGLLREALKSANALEDPVTADMYTEILRTIELDLWFLESHLAT